MRKVKILQCDSGGEKYLAQARAQASKMPRYAVHSMTFPDATVRIHAFGDVATVFITSGLAGYWGYNSSTGTKVREGTELFDDTLNVPRSTLSDAVNATVAYIGSRQYMTAAGVITSIEGERVVSGARTPPTATVETFTPETVASVFTVSSVNTGNGSRTQITVDGSPIISYSETYSTTGAMFYPDTSEAGESWTPLAYAVNGAHWAVIGYRTHCTVAVESAPNAFGSYDGTLALSGAGEWSNIWTVTLEIISDSGTTTVATSSATYYSDGQQSPGVASSISLALGVSVSATDAAFHVLEDGTVVYSAIFTEVSGSQTAWGSSSPPIRPPSSYTTSRGHYSYEDGVEEPVTYSVTEIDFYEHGGQYARTWHQTDSGDYTFVGAVDGLILVTDGPYDSGTYAVPTGNVACAQGFAVIGHAPATIPGDDKSLEVRVYSATTYVGSAWLYRPGSATGSTHPDYLLDVAELGGKTRVSVEASTALWGTRFTYDGGTVTMTDSETVTFEGSEVETMPFLGILDGITRARLVHDE